MKPNLPKTPDPRLIENMCLRFDHSHAMRVPRLKDGTFEIETVEEFERRRDSNRRVMRQLYEEVSGNGFYQYPTPNKNSEKAICLTLPEGDQVELEIAVSRFIESLNIGSDEPWGECYVLQGNILHGIQWSLTEDGDCEIGCSWHENENYFGETK
ncbi:hypothetical protein GAP32_378 [Cronobacter phage vB_CsaM_GAP32]|uniref:Uncharacterized protein n=1 Tax=Cronobacter phage vB_CsaM_GAP32 TaxID=1141136 RepID=K4F9N7_9CAUD|nr:hypothetical protein GAP32_378 [Cronobacter phage vB_CsaM_GAP32]AFC21830.1 hypothetical protein GAP32_378 [Cronobacter phage vB_CsaM_GAP32]